MRINKSHSKNDLVELINILNIPVVFSHQDNKKDIQDKLLQILKTDFKIKKNYYNIDNKEQLKSFLSNQNPKKTLTIKEKNNVMIIAKQIIHYCKTNFDLQVSKYDTHKQIEDDMDYIKQFGDIPSVRRCCKLLKNDPAFQEISFIPMISPSIQKDLQDKQIQKTVMMRCLKIKRGGITVNFD
jgi:hypothetical protein